MAKFLIVEFLCDFSCVQKSLAEIAVAILWCSIQCHAEGGATKGGVSKCEQTQANADRR